MPELSRGPSPVWNRAPPAEVQLSMFDVALTRYEEANVDGHPACLTSQESKAEDIRVSDKTQTNN